MDGTSEKTFPPSPDNQAETAPSHVVDAKKMEDSDNPEVDVCKPDESVLVEESAEQEESTQTVDLTVKQTVDQNTEQPVEHTFEQSGDQTVDQTSDQPMEQTIKQLVENPFPYVEPHSPADKPTNVAPNSCDDGDSPISGKTQSQEDVQSGGAPRAPATLVCKSWTDITGPLREKVDILLKHPGYFFLVSEKFDCFSSFLRFDEDLMDQEVIEMMMIEVGPELSARAIGCV
jgi:hypothetical protein